MAQRAKKAAKAAVAVGKDVLDKLVGATETVIEGVVATVADDAAAQGDQRRENAEAFAKRAEAQRERATAADALDDYIRAQNGRVARFEALGVLAEDHPLELRFANGSRFLDGAIATSASRFKKDGFGTTYLDPIEFERDAPAEHVSEAWVIDGDRAVRCDIPVGLIVGGGHSVAFGAGHLLF